MAEIDTVPLDRAASVTGYGVSIAFDVEAGAKRNNSRIDRDNPIAGAHSGRTAAGTASLVRGIAGGQHRQAAKTAIGAASRRKRSRHADANSAEHFFVDRRSNYFRRDKLAPSRLVVHIGDRVRLLLNAGFTGVSRRDLAWCEIMAHFEDGPVLKRRLYDFILHTNAGDHDSLTGE
jgi:hypothetical protein